MADAPANVIDQELDARGLNCPMPILKTRKAMTAMQTGQVLKVTASDPGSVGDIPAFCNQTGHELLVSQQQGDLFEFMIRKA